MMTLYRSIMSSRLHSVILIFTLCLFIIVLLLQSCKPEEEKSIGQVLAQSYCSTCHLVPQPSALDRLSWTKVLSQMKLEMEKAQYLVDSLDWLTLQQYYLQKSPQQLPLALGKQKIKEVSDWHILTSWTTDEKMVPALTMLNVVSQGEVLAGDAQGQIFTITAKGSHLIDSIESIPLDVMRSEDISYYLAMDVLMPSMEKTGKVISKKGNEETIEIDSLDRPVDFHIADLDHDSQVEIIIANFGSTVGPTNTGNLSIYGYDTSQTLKLIYKKEMPGAVRVQVLDYDLDGDDDIFCLFAQGQETLFYFENKDNLTFKEHLLIQLNPEYGSNDFLVADLDSDNDWDIVLTNGDNGDNTPVHKPYHGLRIFENLGELKFRESVFYPVNGASRVLTTDFDGDDDQDLIVLSMYPNLASFSEEVLLYFENEGKLRFAPSYVFKEPDDKWILMALADLDQNGSDELILGANRIIQGVLVPPRYLKQWNDKGKIMQVWTP